MGWELGRGQKACASLIYSPGTLAVCRSTPWGVWAGLMSAENGLGHRLVLEWSVHYPPLPNLLPEMPLQMAICPEGRLQALRNLRGCDVGCFAATTSSFKI